MSVFFLYLPSDAIHAIKCSIGKWGEKERTQKEIRLQKTGAETYMFRNKNSEKYRLMRLLWDPDVDGILLKDP